MNSTKQEYNFLPVTQERRSTSTSDIFGVSSSLQKKILLIDRESLSPSLFLVFPALRYVLHYIL